LQGIAEIIPAILFVWLGLFLYRALRPKQFSELSAIRLLASLSISLNIFFMATVAIRMHLKPSGTGFGDARSEDMISTPHLIALSIPLSLSLFSAIASALPQWRRRGPAALPG
jgi:hypothetical protein